MRTKRILLAVSICAAIVAALAVTAYGVLLHSYEQCTLLVVPLGNTEYVVEYGQVYEEPGATAIFSGTVIHDVQTDLQVSIQEDVNCDVVGTYLVKYEASCNGFTGTAYRRVHVVDSQAPVITLVADPDKFTFPNETYEEEGFRAVDNYDGDITDEVIRTETKDTVTYTVTDSSGNSTTVNRSIYYNDPIAPSITLKGSGRIVLSQGEKFVEPGFIATDNCDGDLTNQVKITGSVDTSWPGNYTLTYTVMDSYNNTVSVSRTVNVKTATTQAQKIDQLTQKYGKVIYLTFDDGPSQYTPALLDILKKYNVKATFFVVNSSHIDTIKRAAAEGHTVAIHSATHDYKSIYASEDAYFNDLHKMQEIINNLTGKESRLLRFPGGSSNTVSRFNKGIMTRLTRMVQEQGYSYFDWNVDSDDAGGTKTAKGVYRNVINGVSKRKVSIVLQHDTKKYSVNAVEQIIIWGLKNGYTFLPLDTDSPCSHHNVNN